MVKIFRRVSLTFLIIVVFVVAIFLAFQGYGFLGLWLSRNEPLSDSGSSAKAWLDINQNGIWDPSEQPLRDVCIWSVTSPYAYDDASHICQFEQNHTDDQGVWHGEFFAGSNGTDIFIFAEAPSGFHSTSPPAVRDVYNEFGFAPDSLAPIHQVETRYDYVSKDIQNQEFKSMLDGILFWGVIILIVALAIISAIKIDEFLTRRDLA